MVLTLVRKELRETWAYAALGLVLYLIYVSHLTNTGGPVVRAMARVVPGMTAPPPDIPFVGGNFDTFLFFVGAVLAIALGFRQSAWEPSQGTALYLLHLPLSRRSIFLTKLLTGIGLLLACALTPILLYGAWAAAPRTHPGPFEWSMLGASLRTWAVLPLVYLAAFACGMRPGRWFGSRLLPLAAIAVPSIFSAAVWSWWLVGLPTLVLASAAVASLILREAETRDF